VSTLPREAGTDPREAAGEQPTALLDLVGVSKTFPGVKALDELTLEVRQAEILALVGQNGCGKSTLIKILSGYHASDDGAQVSFLGEAVELSGHEFAERYGVAFVHQDLGLVGELSVMENLAIATGFPTTFGRVAWGRLRKRTAQALWTLGYEFDVRAPVSALSASEKVAVAIARAMLHGAGRPLRLLILDEPTASLPQKEVDLLFHAVRRLRAEGISVIFVSHRLDEVFAIADRVAVMRDGRVVTVAPVAEMSTPRLVELMLGHPMEPASEHGDLAARDVEPALTVEELAGQTLARLDLQVYPGEVLGIGGLTGSGREEVAPLLFGAVRRSGGRIRVGDRELDRITPSLAKRHGVALVPAERRSSALLFDSNVRENMLLAGLRAVTRVLVLSRRAERREVESWIRDLSIKTPGGEFPIANLSGGNQQKVVLARWLRMRPTVLILDEPTQGVDVGAKQEIYRYLRQIAREGTAVIVCSTDSEEIVEISDRAVVLALGVVHAELSGPALTINALNHQIAAA
jgi:ribose transport system ATP-binding protein